MPINADRAFLDVPQAHEECGDGGLAAPRMPHKSHHFPWRNLKTDILDDWFVGFVPEGNVVELNVTDHRSKNNGIRFFHDIGFGVEDLEDAVDRHHDLFKLICEFGEPEGGAEHLRDVCHECGNGAVRHLPVQREIDTEDEENCRAGPPDKAGCGGERHAVNSAGH